MSWNAFLIGLAVGFVVGVVGFVVERVTSILWDAFVGRKCP